MLIIKHGSLLEDKMIVFIPARFIVKFKTGFCHQFFNLHDLGIIMVAAPFDPFSDDFLPCTAPYYSL